jgi:excisionase family DNA binding protein
MSCIDAALAAVVVEAMAPLVSELRDLRATVEALRPPQFISVDEAAKRLACSIQTVTAMCKRGELAHRRAGRRLLIDGNSLRPVSPDDIATLARTARGRT